MLDIWNYYGDYQYSVVYKLYTKVQSVLIKFIFILVFALLIFFLICYPITPKNEWHGVIILILGSIVFFVIIDFLYLCLFLPFCRNIIYKVSFYQHKQELFFDNDFTFLKLKDNNDKNSVFLFLPYYYIDKKNDDGLQHFKKIFRHKFWQALALTKETSKDRFALASIRTFGFLIMQVFYILIAMSIYISILLCIMELYNICNGGLSYKYYSLFIYVYIFSSVVIFIYYFKVIVIFKHSANSYHRKYTSLSRLELKIYNSAKSNFITEKSVIARLAFYTKEANKLIEHYINFMGAILLVTLLTTIFIKL